MFNFSDKKRYPIPEKIAYNIDDGDILQRFDYIPGRDKQTGLFTTNCLIMSVKNFVFDTVFVMLEGINMVETGSQKAITCCTWQTRKFAE